VEDLSLFVSGILSFGGIRIISDMEEMPLPNSRRPNHGGIPITSGTEKMPNSSKKNVTESAIFLRKVANGSCVKIKKKIHNTCQEQSQVNVPIIRLCYLSHFNLTQIYI
jgi:hypothetical protein